MFSLVVLLFLLSVLTCFASAQDENYLLYNCSSRADHTSSRIYEKNLKTLLFSLSSDKNNDYGFYSFSEGDSFDRAYAIELCRGDIGQIACQRCVNFSTADLPRRCPTQEEAIVWYDNCMLSYSSRSLLPSRSWRQESIFALSNEDNVTHSKLFAQTLMHLLTILRKKASSGDTHQKFAIRDASYAYITGIYGLVQCRPDLTKKQCSGCLNALIVKLRGPLYGRRGGRVISPNCNLRYDLDPFYEISPPHPFSPPPTAPPPPTPTTIVPPTGRESNNFRIIIISVILTAGCFLMLIIFTFIFIKLRKRKTKRQDNFLLTNAHEDITSIESLQLDFETIRLATDNFKDDNKLGQGGFGSVYKGKLVEGKEIAVKRLAANSGQGDREFKNEALIVGRLQHRNLVRLIGFCLEGNEKLLVYEFLPNSSLDRLLFDPLKRAYLDWKTRYKIISGIAKGLLYLHEDSRLTIIHRDLKAGNILLDEEMCPKIADFGLAKVFIPNQTHGDTSRICGTYGYMAPEYLWQGKFSVKSDVYSCFGIFLLEIISGQKNSCFCTGGVTYVLTHFAWESWKAGTATNLIDPIILNGPRNEILRIIHIGLLCVQDSASARPTMAVVINMLNNASLSLPLPSKPAYLRSIEGDIGAVSINWASITDLYPR